MSGGEMIIDSSAVEVQERSWGGTRALIDTRELDSGRGLSISRISYHAAHHSGRHEDDEAIYVVSGSGEALVEGKATPVHAGSLIVIPAGTDHGLKPAVGVTIEALVMHYTGGSRAT